MPELPGSYDAGKQRINTYDDSNEEHKNIGINNEGVSSSSSSSASSSSSSSSSSFSNRPKHDYEPDHQRSREHDLDRHEINLNNQHNNDYNLHHRHRERHRHDKHPDAPAPALPPSPPDTIVNEFDPAQSPPMLQPGTNVFAPRPNYEHGAVVVDRIDDDFGLPVDRLYDLREAFEGFVAQGSYFIFGWALGQKVLRISAVKIISRPDNSTSFEVIESQLENPLIDADHQDLHALKQLALPGFRHRPHHRRNHSLDDSDGTSKINIVDFSTDCSIS
ncbi:hypothetical protein PV327_002366 [Microctonus hyperodae]|uniref:Uncharacterized protein n=1 Tax=Microctonus hyperodae TaxID=165561 RepID=A0AA39FFK6_MICHY|nr:hypothetical protein PV327_002366 [Microctonus hyperodae]